jgi:hypothetical protein
LTSRQHHRNQRHQDLNRKGGGQGGRGGRGRDQPKSVTVHGQVENVSFSTNKAEYFLDFKEEVFYSGDARANLMSFSKVWEQFGITFNSDEITRTVYLNKNISMVFRDINNLFLCDTRKDIIDLSNNNSLSTSVIQNKSRYSDRDIRGADEARKLIQRLGYPQPQQW